MDVELTFTLQQLLSALLLLVAIFAVCALGVVLVRLAKTLSKINTLLSNNLEPVTQSVAKLPAITEKVDNSLANVESVTETATEVVEEAGEFVDKVITGPANDIVDLLQVLSGLIKLLKGGK